MDTLFDDDPGDPEGEVAGGLFGQPPASASGARGVRRPRRSAHGQERKFRAEVQFNGAWLPSGRSPDFDDLTAAIHHLRARTDRGLTRPVRVLDQRTGKQRWPHDEDPPRLRPEW